MSTLVRMKRARRIAQALDARLRESCACYEPLDCFHGTVKAARQLSDGSWVVYNSSGYVRLANAAYVVIGRPA